MGNWESRFRFLKFKITILGHLKTIHAQLNEVWSSGTMKGVRGRRDGNNSFLHSRAHPKILVLGCRHQSHGVSSLQKSFVYKQETSSPKQSEAFCVQDLDCFFSLCLSGPNWEDILLRAVFRKGQMKQLGWSHFLIFKKPFVKQALWRGQGIRRKKAGVGGGNLLIKLYLQAKRNLCSFFQWKAE